MITYLNSKKEFYKIVWISSAMICCLTTTTQKCYSNPFTISKATLLNHEIITIKRTVNNQDSNEAFCCVSVSVVGTSYDITPNTQIIYELRNIPEKNSY